MAGITPKVASLDWYVGHQRSGLRTLICRSLQGSIAVHGLPIGTAESAGGSWMASHLRKAAALLGWMECAAVPGADPVMTAQPQQDSRQRRAMNAAQLGQACTWHPPGPVSGYLLHPCGDGSVGTMLAHKA